MARPCVLHPNLSLTQTQNVKILSSSNFLHCLINYPVCCLIITRNHIHTNWEILKHKHPFSYFRIYGVIICPGGQQYVKNESFNSQSPGVFLYCSLLITSNHTHMNADCSDLHHDLYDYNVRENVSVVKKNEVPVIRDPTSTLA